MGAIYFIFRQRTAEGVRLSVVGSEMGIRDRPGGAQPGRQKTGQQQQRHVIFENVEPPEAAATFCNMNDKIADNPVKVGMGGGGRPD